MSIHTVYYYTAMDLINVILALTFYGIMILLYIVHNILEYKFSNHGKVCIVGRNTFPPKVDLSLFHQYPFPPKVYLPFSTNLCFHQMIDPPNCLVNLPK